MTSHVVSLRDSAKINPERLARIEAECRRVENEQPGEERDEQEERELTRAAARKAVLFAQKKQAKRVAVPWLAHWLAKIDRLAAMSRNPGYSG